MDLERVYREQYRPLVGFINRRLGNLARAEELAQEAFVRAIEHRPENPRSWLYAVAGNLVRDEGRRLSVRRSHLRVVRSAPPDTAEEPEASLDRDRRRARVHAALRQLSPRDREALLLKEQGLGYEEIARRLGIAHGSVGTTLARARKRLAGAWRRIADGGGDDASG